MMEGGRSRGEETRGRGGLGYVEGLGGQGAVLYTAPQTLQDSGYKINNIVRD